MFARLLLVLLAAPTIRATTTTTTAWRSSGPSSRELSATELDSTCSDCSEQVHIMLGGPGEMVVSYTTLDDMLPAAVTYWEARAGVPPPTMITANGTRDAYSQLIYWAQEIDDPSIDEPTLNDTEILAIQNTGSWAADLSLFPYGKGSSYKAHTSPKKKLGSYKNPAEIYNSPVVCTVTMTSLQPGTTYNYSVAGSDTVYSFTMPPNASEPWAGDVPLYPFTVGLTADIGQTEVALANMRFLRAHLDAPPFAPSPADPRTRGGVVLLAGDLSYADGYYDRWDTYGRLMEPLGARVPVMTTGGNHEISSAEAWVSYNARYPMPFRQSGSLSNLWWSRDIGPVHVVSLCSYAATHRTSLQYRWLERDLRAVDRSVTPWLIVMMHAPWYNSNIGHRGEAELMRLDMEPLLYEHGVDIVLSGHVHAYERTHAVYNGCPDECGPVYLNLGDGGNREGAYVPWLLPQPAWSAFREGTFGAGLLRIVNSTHALYGWTRAACHTLNATALHMDFDAAGCRTVTKYGADNSADPTADADGVWIERYAGRPNAGAPAACSLTPPEERQCSRTTVPPPPPVGTPEAVQPGDDDDDDDDDRSDGGAASAAVGGFFGGMLTMGVVWIGVAQFYGKARRAASPSIATLRMEHAAGSPNATTPSSVLPDGIAGGAVEMPTAAVGEDEGIRKREQV